MKRRLRLAEGLAAGTLQADELKAATDNPVVVQEAARLKKIIRHASKRAARKER